MSSVTTTECKKVPGEECSIQTKQVQVKECIYMAVVKCNVARNVNQQVDKRVCRDPVQESSEDLC